MIRFDIAVANYNKADIFWEGFAMSLRNFDPLLDRIVFLDCSTDPQRELAICLHHLKALNLKESNFVFIKRRNWNLNPGAQLDYIRLIAERYLHKPLFTYFMQDHFLNKNKVVAGDTIPEESVIDLDQIALLMAGNGKLVVGSARYGYRLSASVPEEFTGEDYVSYDSHSDYPWLFTDSRQPFGAILHNRYCNDHFIYYNGRHHIPGSQDICLTIDGSNFCVDPIYYVNHYVNNKMMYSRGIGDYGEGLTWETRLSKILADQGLGFYELSRNVCFWSPQELKSAQPDPDLHLPFKLWCYFYNSPLFYSIHGHDIWPYRFKNTDAYLRYAHFCYEFSKTVDRDETFNVMYDPKGCVCKF